MRGFWKNIISVFVGTVFVQLIPILASLLITRIFVPEVFGEFSTWLAVVTLIAVMVTLRLETALAITGDGVVRKKAVLFISLISLGITFALLLILLMLYVLGFTSSFFLSNYLLLLCAPAALVLALNVVWQTWAAVEGHYNKMTLMRIIQAAVLAVLQILFGVFYPTALSLSISFFVAGLFSFVVCLLLMPNVLRQRYFKLLELKAFVSRYKRFPIYSLPADAINTATAQLPLIVIAYRFGLDVAGFFSLTLRVLGAPIGLVGKAILDVFKRYAAQQYLTQGNCKKLYEVTFLGLAAASVVFVVTTCFVGETIFQVAFGDDWRMSGTMAIWLIPMFAMRFMASPLSYMVYIVEKQHVDLMWQLGLAIVTLMSLYVLSDYKNTLILYSLLYAAMYCIYLWLSYGFSKGELK